VAVAAGGPHYIGNRPLARRALGGSAEELDEGVVAQEDLLRTEARRPSFRLAPESMDVEILLRTGK